MVRSHTQKFKGDYSKREFLNLKALYFLYYKQVGV